MYVLTIRIAISGVISGRLGGLLTGAGRRSTAKTQGTNWAFGGQKRRYGEGTLLGARYLDRAHLAGAIRGLRHSPGSKKQFALSMPVEMGIG